MFKRIKVLLLRFTHITHAQLIDAGFETFEEKLWYQMGDLIIYMQRNRFYYFAPDAKRIRIKNMLQVSDLVYGKTPYLN